MSCGEATLLELSSDSSFGTENLLEEASAERLNSVVLGVFLATGLPWTTRGIFYSSCERKREWIP